MSALTDPENDPVFEIVADDVDDLDREDEDDDGASDDDD